MSCCIVDKKVTSTKEIVSLKKKFDSVEVENLSDYRLLTLKDKTNRQESLFDFMAA